MIMAWLTSLPFSGRKWRFSETVVRERTFLMSDAISENQRLPKTTDVSVCLAENLSGGSWWKSLQRLEHITRAELNDSAHLQKLLSQLFTTTAWTSQEKTLGGIWWLAVEGEDIGEGMGVCVCQDEQWQLLNSLFDLNQVRSNALCLAF